MQQPPQQRRDAGNHDQQQREAVSTPVRTRAEQLFLTHRIALVAETHELASRTSLTVADLDGYPLTGVDPRQGEAFVDFFLLRAERNGERPRRVLRSATFADSFFHVLNHGAVATPTADATRVLFAPYLRAIPLCDAAASGAVAVRRKDDRRPHVHAFMRIARAIAQACQHLVPDALPLRPADAVGAPD